MKHGDFTTLAKNYIYRPAYSPLMITSLLRHVGGEGRKNFAVAEVGCGTGKLTAMLAERRLNIFAVEPNDAMRAEGMKNVHGKNVHWSKGSGEKTGLPKASADWAVMASSFHWTDPKVSLPEFSRILKPGGHFTILWNPRNIEASKLHTDIEKTIYKIAPNIKRRSSGSKSNAKNWEEILISTGHFGDVVFMETDHVEVMSPERYMGAWHSVNDIRVQAGEVKWKKIIAAIEKAIAGVNPITVPYKIRAWTAQKVS